MKDSSTSDDFDDLKCFLNDLDIKNEINLIQGAKEQTTNRDEDLPMLEDRRTINTLDLSSQTTKGKMTSIDKRDSQKKDASTKQFLSSEPKLINQRYQIIIFFQRARKKLKEFFQYLRSLWREFFSSSSERTEALIVEKTSETITNLTPSTENFSKKFEEQKSQTSIPQIIFSKNTFELDCWWNFGEMLEGDYHERMKELILLYSKHKIEAIKLYEQHHAELKRNFEDQHKLMIEEIEHLLLTRFKLKLHTIDDIFCDKMTDWSFRRLEHIILMDHPELLLVPLLAQEIKLFRTQELEVSGPAYLESFFEEQGISFHSKNISMLIIQDRKHHRSFLVDLEDAFKNFFQDIVLPDLLKQMTNLLKANESRLQNKEFITFHSPLDEKFHHEQNSKTQFS